MRTTLTLEDDVAAKLEERCRRSGRTFKDVVNDLLRLGLEASRTARAKPYRVRARPLYLRDGLSLDNVAEVLEQLDGPDHR